MEEHQYASIQQMRGSMSYRSAPDPAAFERVNYMRMLSSYVAAREGTAV
jgi:dihydroorotate dehydrogenase (fumarate)